MIFSKIINLRAKNKGLLPRFSVSLADIRKKKEPLDKTDRSRGWDDLKELIFWIITISNFHV